MSPHRVVITGVGVISPFGRGLAAFWNGLKSGQGALAVNERLQAVVGAVPTDADPCSSLSSGQLREMSRGSVFAVAAASEALKDAGIDDVDEGFHNDTAVNIGMGIADLNAIHDAGSKIDAGNARRISPFFVPRILTNIPASYVSMTFKLRGGNSSTTTACATGASAIADAFFSIKHGQNRRVVAGATEACLVPMAVEGFKRMRALATDQDPDVSRPFDAKRQGFVLSEGAGIVVLERLEDALARKAAIYAELLGFGSGNDAHHLTAPRDDGFGSTLCMQRCLSNSGVSSSQVGYVNAHATSTPVGDKAEAASIATALPGVTVSSIKGHTGHTLAAAGALETICTAMSVREGEVIATRNLGTSDFDFEVELVSGKQNPTVPWQASGRRIALMNSFGFGGAFVSLCLGECRH